MLKHSGIEKFRHRLISATALARAFAVIVPMMVAGEATAQTAPTATYDIPAQDLTGALRQFAEASHLQLVDEANITDGKSSPGVIGRFTAEEAARRLLAGTGLTFEISSGAIVVTAAVKRSGVALGNVVVQGANQLNGATAVNGINGSHDVEATEGTGSYTTGGASIVSKMPLSLRETPQSVSVLTSAQIADQNITTLRQGLEQMPGLTLTTAAGGNQNFQIVSRGFAITSFEFDGGSPVTERQSYNPLINLAEYDSIQLIRGADGLFNGYGDPSGVINLVRKKPLDHNQFTYEQDAGSYSNFREVADVTGPLAFNGHLRARVVLSEQDNKFYYKVANDHNFLGYGILEADLGSKTTISVGSSINRDILLPSYGLPRYYNGDPLDVPVSTCFCVVGNHVNTTTKEFFAIIEHHFSKDWFTKLNVTYNDQNIRSHLAAVTGPIAPGTTIGGTISAGGNQYFPNQQIAIDYNFNGGFRVLGRTQSFVFGASYSMDNTHQGVSDSGSFGSATGPSSIPVNVFAFDPYSSSYIQYLNGGGSNTDQKTYQYGIYANIRLEPLKGLHFTVGERFSGFTTYNLTNSHFGTFAFSNLATRIADHSHSSPNFSGTYDLPAHFTVYGSYSNIYVPQLPLTKDTLGNTIAPEPSPAETGKNEEGGLKWESPNRRFNASAAYYYIQQNNIRTSDRTVLQGVSFGLENRISKGVEVEATGEIVPGLQIAASYAYNDNKHTNLNPTTQVVVVDPSSVVAAVEPHHLIKLFATYHIAADNWLNRLTVGGGMNYQSDAFYSGTVCPGGHITVSSTGRVGCNVSTQPFNFVTKGYATANVQMQYQLNRHINLTFTVNNLTNVKTYQTSSFESPTYGNYYLPPANFMFAIKTKW